MANSTGKKRLSARPWAESCDLTRWQVYQELPAVTINDPPTVETRRQADVMFQTLHVRGYKLAAKREFFARLLQTGKRAAHMNGCVRYPRRHQHIAEFQLQVIDAAVKVGFFASYRSPAGAPMMSRLVPLTPITTTTPADPWKFDPSTHYDPKQPPQLVFLRRRDDKSDIPFDPTDGFPRRVQRKLERINAVNSEWNIYYRPYNEWEDSLNPHGQQRNLRPVHYAIFTDDWVHHGRIYTGRYGHQSLRKVERQTITFNGEPSAELDFSGLHTRMLYHRAGIDFTDDPYRLWGTATTPAQRLMAKTLINAAINAKDRRSAIAACNRKMLDHTSDGDWKTGKEAQRAAMLWRAVRETGLTFNQVYELALQRHRGIAEHFGSDAGMTLMNLDGAIALEIMTRFAKRGVPCLGCHDSFIVPDGFSDELIGAMAYVYRDRLGFNPVVTR